MPRKLRTTQELPRSRFGDLVDELAEELKTNRESGQPLIDEQHFPTGAVRVAVLWDRWDHVPQEDRTAIILRAYEKAEGQEFRDRIALAYGLTIPEAHASGMLPYQVFPALRKGDPVTADLCKQAMIVEGASVLLDPDHPQLRFTTEEEAAACKTRLAQMLPDSEPVWVVTRDMGPVEDWTGGDLS